MGRTIKKRLIYTLACFLIAACIVYLNPPDDSFSIKEPLNLTFSNIEGWEPLDVTDLSKSIIDSLYLDDYLFRSYTKNGKVVTLYIGYYRKSDKIGAAHSPLVCLPGQGWEITLPQKVRIKVGEEFINSEKLISKKGSQQDLIIYWFQSNEETSSGTFKQKINNLIARIKGGGSENAFIRVSVSIKNDNVDDAFLSIEKFICDFYPILLKYITN